MKRKGRHPDKALSAVAVRALKAPGRYADGNGLYLVVDPSGAKRWILRTIALGKRRDIGLGGTALVSLAEARESATKLRKIARDGGDPISERRKTRSVLPTFRKAACQVHAEYRPSWKNAKHAAQWLSTLETYAFPKIGNLPVDAVDTPQILEVLLPIWLRKPETARRVRQRIGAVLDWARVAGYRTGENPVMGMSKGLPKQPRLKSHHKALPYTGLCQFLTSLRKAASSRSSCLALEFLVLTATRTREVLQAEWSEISLDHREWLVPAERMKAGTEFRVPLSEMCIEILSQARTLSNADKYIFPGQSDSSHLSNTALLMIIRRMGLDVTVHGFRSTFRDWASETTNFPREVCEMALAHSVENKVEAAYRRGDLFTKRRRLMESWAAFANRAPAEVVSLEGHAQVVEEHFG